MTLQALQVVPGYGSAAWGLAGSRSVLTQPQPPLGESHNEEGAWSWNLRKKVFVLSDWETMRFELEKNRCAHVG